MYHYLFTNDLRISNLKDSLVYAAKCYINDNIPSASENKSANNNITSLRFYFNLTKSSNCSKLASKGEVIPVILNFIKKFQFPNLRRKDFYEQCKSDGIILAPMRVIIKTLYIMNILYDKDQSYLTKNEIKNFIFYNETIAKNPTPDLNLLINDLIKYRKNRNIPDYVNINKNEHEWNQEDRQLREMIRVLSWSGCITMDNDIIKLVNKDITCEIKAMIYDIINYNEYWDGEDIESYQQYMDIESTFLTESDSYDLCDYNKIIYGIPGCGKSYYVEHDILKNVDKNNNVIRTTFFLDYSNSDFIGQILPFVKDKDVTYKYVPGPFTKALEKAYKNKNEMFYLVIEEINRGNAAAIFGDIFQLLDRLKKDSNDDERIKGDSEYPISNEFIEGYLKQEKVNFTPEKIYIPHNLTIIATMNTSDQNVFPLDTAFKRRWKMKRITNTWKDHPFADEYIPFTNITWKTFVETINLQIINSSEDGLLLEDKQLGEFFADEEMFVKEKADECIVDDEKKEKLESFTNKVIEYLYNDVFKFNKDKLFENKKSFNEIWETINRYDDDTFKGSRKLCLKVDFNTTEVSSKNTNHTNNGEEISGE